MTTCLLVSCHFVSAQTLEYGMSIGGSSYNGEVGNAYNLRNIRPGGSLFFRYNPHPQLSWRLSYSIMNLTASDSYYDNATATRRDAKFNKIINEASFVMEFNYLSYRDADQKEVLKSRWTPYFFLGAGAMFYPTTVDEITRVKAAFVIPMGMGAKVFSGKRSNFGIDIGARKTFVDDLDGVNADASFGQAYFKNDNDWYFYTGVTLSHVLYQVECPKAFRRHE